jgi:glycerol transport system ATP-binding protein
VMHDGMVVQIGSPVDLFERPQHTFVGHFIGSPGMNVLRCTVSDGATVFAGQPVAVQNPPSRSLDGQRLELGVRPEFVTLADTGIPVRIAKVSDGGRYRIVEAIHGESRIRLLLDEAAPLPADSAHLRFDPGHTRLYADGWLVS